MCQAGAVICFMLHQCVKILTQTVNLPLILFAIFGFSIYIDLYHISSIYSEDFLFLVCSIIIMLSISPLNGPLANTYGANFELLLIIFKKIRHAR